MKTRTWLSELRKTQGLTKSKIASMVGITRTAYTMIETGDRNPSVPTAQKIAEVLQFNWVIFYGQSGNHQFPNQIANHPEL